MNPRTIATKILTEVTENGRSLTSALSLIDKQPKITEPALIKELCYGVLRWYFRLTALLSELMKQPLKAKDADVSNLLLIGLYQIIYLRIPDHAAVTETVNAVRDLKKPWATGLINAVLRNFLRNHETLQTKLDANPVSRYAHPLWLIKMLQQTYPDAWESILTANNQHPPLCLRVNALQISRDDYLTLLAAHGINAFAVPFAPQGVVLTEPQDVNRLPGFAAGQCSVQDSAAQLAASLLMLAPGQRVLDACAAPGGKTAHIIEQQPNIAALVAVDEDEERLDKAIQNWQRLQLPKQIQWQVANAAQTTWWDGQLFDRILLDAPCSATGVIRRHSDIKLLREAKDISALAAEQKALLIALWPLLKPGGLLLYATCSILPQENEEVVLGFLREELTAEEQKITASWGLAKSVGRQILPGEQGMDGFYYACLVKKH
ncbi:MAG TPA: 16S rRNA (cytosine(967)-C(5))-methyltransferase RsmB [Gammaproteobacteria bacterium]|nr:16S rRNA (cytosine(967)-C(5))-methyltransferase RsmB [Gammaproteobacteria bacterium]